MKREIRSDYARECPDMAYPKMRRVKDKHAKSAPESDLQEFTNNYLKAKGLPYLRLSEKLLVNIFRNPSIPVHVKRHIKEEVAGWPDNLVLVPLGNGLNLAMAQELKTEAGTLTQAQRIMDHEIEMVVARSEDEVKANVKALEVWAKKMAAVLVRPAKPAKKNDGINYFRNGMEK